MEQNRWKLISREGNPKEEGVYDCVLIRKEVKLKDPDTLNTGREEWIPTGKVFAFRDSRWFGPASPDDGWLMDDQPTEGLAWHEESGSYVGETVYAWLPERDYPEIELPDGVTWGNESEG